jgi:putative ABC transport system permease protein
VPQRSRAERFFRVLVRLFPFDFRADHGRDLEQTLHAQHQEAREAGGVRALARLWLEVVRDVFTTAPREHVAILKQDLGYALRALKRAPVFAASAVLTLALGMSTVTGMVAIVNAIMLRPLEVDHPEQLVSISSRTEALEAGNVSYRDLQDYRALSRVLIDAAGYAPRPATLTVNRSTERIGIEAVTDNYFTVLGVRAAIGRLIRPGEGRARGDAPVLVLAHDYWQSRFAGDPSIVGRDVRVNGKPFTIIGVTAPPFRDTQSLVRVAAFMPAWMLDTTTEPVRFNTFEDRAARTFMVLGRLQPGVSLAQARIALDAEAARLAREYPSTNKNVSLLVVPETETRPTARLGPFLRMAGTALLGLAALVLLITSANVANLMMARAASRGREVALRAALGARRGRIMRQFMTEGVALALLGGLLAVPVVVMAMGALQAFIASASSAVTLDPDFGVDGRVLLAAFAIATFAGVVTGMAPALSACRADLTESLRSGARAGIGGTGGRFRQALVVAQVALSLSLLVCGGLFIRSLDRARAVDLGFEPAGLLLASASPGIQGYTPAQRRTLYTRARERVAALPGVERAAWTSFAPLGIIGEIAEVSPDARPTDPAWRPPVVSEFEISPEYFETTRMTLVEGRPFNDGDDEGSKRVVIVDETVAGWFWPEQNAVGHSLVSNGVSLEVVGVTRQGKYQTVTEAARGAVFKPFAQSWPGTATLVIRTTGAPVDLAPAVRSALRQVDPEVAVYDVRSMSTHLDNGSAFFPFRLGAFMTGLFGAMGVLLAAVGLYGMIAYHVGQRTQEIGLRMALGARGGDIIGEVLLRGGRFAAIGIAVGVALSAAIAQLLRNLLVGVSPFDPATYASVAAFLVLICLLASFVPARRATVVDPLIALRAE